MAQDVEITGGSVSLSGDVTVTGMPASVGQKAMAASLPVVVASDQSAFPTRQEVYTTITTGEKAPGAGPVAAQLPSVAAKLVRIKARSSNSGKVAIGSANTVILPNGVTGTVEGLELAAGDDTGWLPVDNLNKFWMIGTGDTDSVTYMVLS